MAIIHCSTIDDPTYTVDAKINLDSELISLRAYSKTTLSQDRLDYCVNNMKFDSIESLLKTYLGEDTYDMGDLIKKESNVSIDSKKLVYVDYYVGGEDAFND